MGVPAEGRELRVGERIAELPVEFDLDGILAYERVHQHWGSIHNDPDIASKAGFSSIFASGTMLLAYAAEHLLPGQFGESWSDGGAIGLTFLRPLVPGDRVLLTADVVAKLPRGGNTEVVLELKATLESGELVATGAARATLQSEVIAAA